MSLRFCLPRILGIAVVSLGVIGVRAQGPPGGPPPDGGGPPPSFSSDHKTSKTADLPPGLQKKLRTWQSWNSTHKNVYAVQNTLSALAEMDATEPNRRLTPDQATRIAAVLKAWQARPVMTDTQAKKVNMDLTLPLTLAQLKRVTLAYRTTATGQSGGGEDMSGGGPGEQIPDPKEFNPLNPATLPFVPMRPVVRQRIDTLLRSPYTRTAHE